MLIMLAIILLFILLQLIKIRNRKRIFLLLSPVPFMYIIWVIKCSHHFTHKKIIATLLSGKATNKSINICELIKNTNVNILIIWKMIGNHRKNYTEVNNLMFLTEGGKNPKQCHHIKYMTNDSKNVQHSHLLLSVGDLKALQEKQI